MQQRHELLHRLLPRCCSRRAWGTGRSHLLSPPPPPIALLQCMFTAFAAAASFLPNCWPTLVGLPPNGSPCGSSVMPPAAVQTRLRQFGSDLKSGLAATVALLHRRQAFAAWLGAHALAGALGWDWSPMMHLAALEEGAHRQCMDVAAVLLASRHSSMRWPIDSELSFDWLSHLEEWELFNRSMEHSKSFIVCGSNRMSSSAALERGAAATLQVRACVPRAASCPGLHVCCAQQPADLACPPSPATSVQWACLSACSW